MRPHAGSWSAPTGSPAGGHLLGRASRAVRIGSRPPQTRSGGAGRRLQPESHRDRGLPTAHEQPPPRRGARECSASCEGLWSAEGLRGECVAADHARSRALRREDRSRLAAEAGGRLRRARSRPWAIGILGWLERRSQGTPHQARPHESWSRTGAKIFGCGRGAVVVLPTSTILARVCVSC